MDTAKPFTISKQNVLEAYKRVKSNKGAAGIDDPKKRSCIYYEWLLH